MPLFPNKGSRLPTFAKVVEKHMAINMGSIHFFMVTNYIVKKKC
jgi:hypothetical protein